MAFPHAWFRRSSIFCTARLRRTHGKWGSHSVATLPAYSELAVAITDFSTRSEMLPILLSCTEWPIEPMPTAGGAPNDR
jgi:hypothetical protein